MFENKEDNKPFKYLKYWFFFTLFVIAVTSAADRTTTSPPVPITVPAVMYEKLPVPEVVQVVQALPDVPLDAEHIKAVVDACEKYSVPVELALAVMDIESEYQTNAVNGACVGLYQINTDYIAAYEDALGVTDITDPVQNIESGVWYLGQLLEKHGEVNLALMHYHLGNKADRLWEQGQHSTNYTDKVNAAWEQLGGEDNG